MLVDSLSSRQSTARLYASHQNLFYYQVGGETAPKPIASPNTVIAGHKFLMDVRMIIGQACHFLQVETSALDI